MDNIQQMPGFALSPDWEENLGETFVIHTEYVGKSRLQISQQAGEAWVLGILKGGALGRPDDSRLHQTWVCHPLWPRPLNLQWYVK